MKHLIGYFESNDDAEAVENALCSGGLVTVNQEGEQPAEIVASFAETIPGLTGETLESDFVICYRSRTRVVALERRPADGDRVRRAIRDVLQPEYEFRVLRSCLGTDTLAMVVNTPANWQQVDSRFSRLATELFTSFSDDIEFDVSP